MNDYKYQQNFKEIKFSKEGLIEMSVHSQNESNGPLTPFDDNNIHLALYDTIIKYANKEYNFTFPEDFLENTQKYEGKLNIGDNEVDGFLLPSRCIFKTDDPDHRVTTLFLYGYNCIILCYHDTCKQEKLYKGIEGALRSFLSYSLVRRDANPFKFSEFNIGEAYNDVW